MRFLILAAALPLMACSFHHHHHDDDGDSSSGIAGTGSGSARTYQVADFSKIELAGSADVDVKIGTAFSVRAEGDSDELDRLKIEKDGDTLSIGRRGHHHFSWGGEHKGVKVYVTMPRIAATSMAGSGDITIDRVEGASFASDVAGSSNLSIAAMAVKQARFSLHGSGDVSLKGNADTLKIDIAGHGNVDARGLTAKSADVSIAGSGDVKAQVNGTASVSIMGSGDVDLGPNAKCSVSKMGSGSVTCGAGGSTS